MMVSLLRNLYFTTDPSFKLKVRISKEGVRLGEETEEEGVCRLFLAGR